MKTIRIVNEVYSELKKQKKDLSYSLFLSKLLNLDSDKILEKIRERRNKKKKKYFKWR